jgi:hypothetical protein
MSTHADCGEDILWVHRSDDMDRFMDQGFKVRVVDEVDYGPGTTTITELMTGRRGKIGELYIP